MSTKWFFLFTKLEQKTEIANNNKNMKVRLDVWKFVVYIKNLFFRSIYNSKNKKNIF